MARHRHVAAVDVGAATGTRRRPDADRPVDGRRPAGRQHRGTARQAIAARTVELALTCVPAPNRILDIGCGTGTLLRQLAAVSPTAVALVGIDTAPRAIAAARAAGGDERLRFDVGTVEGLRYADGAFDLVVSTVSFLHWADQSAGLAQCARVLAPGGQLVLTDRFSALSAVLTPGLPFGGRPRARTRRGAELLLAREGFRSVQWHDVHGRRVRAVTAAASRGGWPVSTRAG